MSAIEDYALIGDLHTAALVSKTGSIDWLCLPRFDSPACFAALLHDDSAGHWTLAPVGASTCTRRRYVPGTIVLETEWQTPDGSVVVTDFMPPRGETPRLIRIVTGVSGAVPIRSVLRLRFDYGRVVPWVRHDADRLEAVAGPDHVRVDTEVPTRGEDWASISDFTVRPGDRVPFVLTWSPSHRPDTESIDAEDAQVATEKFWTAWSKRAGRLHGPYQDAVTRSLLTLKALIYAPTGGIIAAPTTSLPEQLGGSRNWDYRYCWLRDSTYTLQALLSAGYVAEAKAWREWLLRAIAGQPDTLQIMYGIDGSRRLPEAELDWLTGYEGSSPVRIGNAASGQLQLDVWGETLDGLFLAREAGLGPQDDAWALQVALMNHLESQWQEPDNGLWEVRGGRRHFVHSKVMAWVAADRMARTVRRYGNHGPVQRWEELRATIHQEVLTRGFNSDRNSFVQAYGSRALDASVLLIPRVGFLPATDERVLGTIAAIRRDLTEDGFVKRYETADTDDGLTGAEGMFIACSYWLVDALHASGQVDEATRLFERLLDLRNDVGLLSEEWDPIARRQLGNTPQAFSHFGLVVSAVQLHTGSPKRSDEMPHTPNKQPAP